MKSWKTTVGGILAAIAIGFRSNHQLAPYADALEAIGIGLVGLSARDNNVTSEQAGAIKKAE